jgi:hypothetical protein
MAAGAAPTPSAETTPQALESADTSAPAPAAEPTLGLAQEPGYSAPPGAPAGGNVASATSPPIAASGDQPPDTDRLDRSVPQVTSGRAPLPTIQPIRLLQLSLAGLALLLGLGALWVRRRGR